MLLARMPDLIISVVAKIAGSLLVAVAKAGYSKLTEMPAFAKAIASTADQFRHLEVRHALLKWCESERFKNILAAIEDGNRSVADREVVAAFVEVGEFYVGDSTDRDAEAVVKYFFDSLVEEIYRSKEGVVAAANRQEILH